jgi:signal transduction histidine kinase
MHLGKAFSIACLAVGLTMQASGAELSPRGILVIDEFNSDSPFARGFRQRIHSTLDRETTTRYALYSESLDTAHSYGPDYEPTTGAYFATKYRHIQIGVIVALGPKALNFVSQIRTKYWPKTPIVFATVGMHADKAFTTPSDSTGTIVVRRFRDTIDSARLLIPDLAEVVLVGNSLDRQPFRGPYQDELQQISKELRVLNLTDIPLEDALPRLVGLPPDSAIIYTPIYIDKSGLIHNPGEALSTVAEVASRPIVVDSEAFIGIGATGGSAPSPDDLGRETASKIARILHGEAAADIPVTVRDIKRPVFDGRQLERWGIEPASLPIDSDIRFKKPNIWELYRWQIIAAAIVFAIQGLAITLLVYERHRRRTAERDSHQHLLEVTKLDRAVTAGGMSTSIAHELSQPLGAILSNTEAAELMLGAASPDLDQIKEILEDIRRDDQRAVSIITHLRMLLKQNKLDVHIFNLAQTVRDVVEILEPLAKQQDVSVQVDVVPANFSVKADPVHIQQVLLNLAVNAIEAMQNVPALKRKLILRSAATDNEIVTSVEDSGTGIPQGKLKRIFEPFVTTKENGTGLGLSIAKTIINTYGGRIWVQNRAEGGAAFYFALQQAQTELA